MDSCMYCGKTINDPRSAITLVYMPDDIVFCSDRCADAQAQNDDIYIMFESIHDQELGYTAELWGRHSTGEYMPVERVPLVERMRPIAHDYYECGTVASLRQRFKKVWLQFAEHNGINPITPQA